MCSIDQEGQLVVTPEQLGNWKIIFDSAEQSQIISFPNIGAEPAEGKENESPVLVPPVPVDILVPQTPSETSSPPSCDIQTFESIEPICETLDSDNNNVPYSLCEEGEEFTLSSDGSDQENDQTSTREFLYLFAFYY